MQNSTHLPTLVTVGVMDEHSVIRDQAGRAVDNAAADLRQCSFSQRQAIGATFVQEHDRARFLILSLAPWHLGKGRAEENTLAAFRVLDDDAADAQHGRSLSCRRSDGEEEKRQSQHRHER